jgi:hypothetical protein
MSRLAQGLLLAAALAATALGFAALHRLRVSKGDVFPPYSSFRADALGTRALHDSLAALPGVRVDRGFIPLEGLRAPPQRTIIVAGLTTGQWKSMTREQFAGLEDAVKRGDRLVLALRADFADEDSTAPAAKAAPAKGGAAPAKPPAPPPARKDLPEDKPESPYAAAPLPADLGRLWGIELSKVGRISYEKGAALEPGAPAGLPRSVRWKSDICFTTRDPSWRVVYRSLGKPVVLEMRHGRGSVVVAGDAYILSNEALMKDRYPALLSWLVGQNPRVEFDEGHLGVAEETGMAALVRRYGLAGAAGTLLLLALLFIWQRTAPFVPPPEESPEVLLDCSHTKALEHLLERSIPRNRLIEACESEWRATAAPSAAARVGAALAPRPGATPADFYNAAVRALARKQPSPHP